MNNNDDTKQKLVESMRITKAGSVKPSEVTDSPQTAAAQEDQIVKKEKKTAAPKKTTSQSHNISADPYQSVSRVWPD